MWEIELCLLRPMAIKDSGRPKTLTLGGKFELLTLVGNDCSQCGDLNNGSHCQNFAKILMRVFHNEIVGSYSQS